MLIYGSLSISYVPHTPRAIGRLFLSYALNGIYGMLVSHWLFLRLSRGWIDLPLRQLLLRLVPSILGGAVLMALGLKLINDDLLNMMGPRISLASFFFFVANCAFLLSGWAVLYALLHQARQRRLAEKRRVETELAMREAQHRFLAAQVQPHFFFNALNTIRALIYEDPKEADRALTKLAALLRAGLRSEGRKEVSLEEELRVVDDYLALEKLRFENRLRVSIAVDDSVRLAMLPPMSLQHLVENALKHGIAHREDGGEVSIEALERDGRLCVTVRNSVAARDARSAFANQETDGLGGFGLANTRERLRLLHGAYTGLVLESTQNCMSAKMELPLVRREEHAYAAGG